jgi:hypothetical protein
MNSAMDTWTLLQVGCPIRKSPGLSLFSGSPKLIAAFHVLHRLPTPRHPPIALISLTIFLYPNKDKKTKNPYSLFKEQKKSFGGGERVRTDDLLRARQALSQLSYTPKKLVGLVGIEPTTSRLSGVRSNRI